MHPREVALVGALVLFLLVPWVVVRDIWRRPAAVWSAAGRSRWLWTAVCVLVPVVGPISYLRLARRDLRPANRTGAS